MASPAPPVVDLQHAKFIFKCRYLGNKLNKQNFYFVMALAGFELRTSRIQRGVKVRQQTSCAKVPFLIGGEISDTVQHRKQRQQRTKMMTSF